MPSPEFEARWSRHRELLCRCAHGLAGPDAEDLVQETILRLLQVAPEQAFSEGYAVTTLTRLWIDRQRRMKARLARLARLGRAAPRHRPLAPEPEDVWRARDAVDHLPPRQRAAFVLRVIAELDYAGIAQALECDVGAVRANLHLARQALRARLGTPGGEP